MEAHAHKQAPTGMALAMIEGCGSVEKLMKAVEGNAPSGPAKKDIPMPSSKPAAKSGKSPIERLYDERVGKKVVVGDFTFLIEERKSARTQELTRVLRVVKSKDNLCLDRFLFVHELDQEQLSYKPNSPVQIYDDKVVLHALLRPLAVAAGLAKKQAPKKAKKTQIKKGRDKVSKPVASPLVRIDTVVAPGSAPLANFGIERLLSAPEGKKVIVGSHSFIVEDGDHDNGPSGRRYVCVRAPEDFGLGNWVMDDDVRSRTSPRLPESVQGKLREAKIGLHQLLRDSAIDARLVKGKYAERPAEAITDQAVVMASIRDGIHGRFQVEHPDFEENAIIGIELEDGKRGKELQIILIRGNDGGLDGVRAGVRIPHKQFMSRKQYADMPSFVSKFFDWLDESCEEALFLK